MERGKLNEGFKFTRPESEGRKIGVSVEGDKVTLSGNVHSFSERVDAGFAAWGAPGVMNVENNLKIAA